MPTATRVVTERDLARAGENRRRAESMQRTAAERIAAQGLVMKVINTHLSLDGRLAIFQFTAEGRVDFRDLLRDLSRRLRTRVELRQVGVRDEAAIQGGIGSCGRPFCCVTFLKRFSSINVKMAKKQGLSLNPANISGACGRLKCCLQYDAHLYRGGRCQFGPASAEEPAAGPPRGRKDTRGPDAPDRAPSETAPPSGSPQAGNGGGRRGSDGDGSAAGGGPAPAAGDDSREPKSSRRRSGRRRRRRSSGKRRNRSES
jgi:hypothetical protein